MSILALLFILIVIGVALYVVNTVIPMDPKIKTIINVVVVLLVLVWLADLFFGLGGLSGMRVGRPLR